MTLLDNLRQFALPPDARQALDRLPDAHGRFDRDPWGYDKEKSKYIFGLAKRLYDEYFRVQSHGLEHVPTTGRVRIGCGRRYRHATSAFAVEIATSSFCAPDTPTRT